MFPVKLLLLLCEPVARRALASGNVAAVTLASRSRASRVDGSLSPRAPAELEEDTSENSAVRPRSCFRFAFFIIGIKRTNDSIRSTMTRARSSCAI